MLQPLLGLVLTHTLALVTVVRRAVHVLGPAEAAVDSDSEAVAVVVVPPPEPVDAPVPAPQVQDLRDTHLRRTTLSTDRLLHPATAANQCITHLTT